MKFYNFNEMEFFTCSEDQIKEWMIKVLDELKKDRYFWLEEYFPDIKDFNYDTQDYEEKVKDEIGSKLSNFMALQEALMRLVNANHVLPTNNSRIINPRITIKFTENNTYSSSKNIVIPTIPYNAFVLAPSKRKT